MKITCGDQSQRPERDKADGVEVDDIGGCGREIDLPEPALWDVNTNAEGQIIERHKQMLCPHCGYSGNRNWISLEINPPEAREE